VHLDIVIPAHNEEHRIDRTLHAYRSQCTRPGVSFLVALDRCTDRTEPIVRAHADADRRVVPLCFPKLGKGGVLIETFRRTDPEIKNIANPEFAQYPLSWNDWRPKMYTLAVLGELRCAASKSFLKEYLAMDEAQAREFSPPQFEEAAKALLRQDLSGDELKWLLRSPHSVVRGTAILECIDHPRVDRTAALGEVAPWSLNLPAGYK